jgi:ABC-type multidrug transport system ATPase subunit
MGRNGSGKTTLLRIAAGVLRADRGTVLLDDVRQRRVRLSRLARAGLTYLPQEGLLVRGYRVGDHVRAVHRCRPLERYDDVLAASGLRSLLDRRVEELSKGERVRASLSVALLCRPTVLLADEPLTGLDPRDQEELGRTLRRAAESGVAVVVSGHDATVLFSIVDDVVWLVAGSTRPLGGPAEAVLDDDFRRGYLGPAAEGSQPPAGPGVPSV